MGPTFIKIGQFVSTRSDIFSKEITDELKELQDNVLPLKWNDIKYKVDTNLFDSIDENPLASASIGQVHKAILKNKDVVIKIKRPGIDTLIKADFDGLLVFIKWMKLFSNDRRLIEFQILFTEYYNLLLEEIDFIKEANNIIQFTKMFEKTKWIRIPLVYKELSNNDYIIMEYVPSIKIDNIEKMKSLGFNLEKVASKLIECYVEQIINCHIHVDCHPSNLCITENGQIVFYDFGMVVNLDDRIKLYFDDLLIAVYNKDIDIIANLLVDIGLIIVEPGKISYLKKFIIFFLSYIEKMNVDDLKISYLSTLNKNAMPFLISSKFLLILRGLSILEGNCKLIDANFNYKKTLDPYIDKYLYVNFIENKMIGDIAALKSFPTKIKEQEIELEIMKMNVQYDNIDKENIMKIKSVALGGIVIIMAILENDIVPPIYSAILSAILLL
jgi:predicted unusual protein kinase regulating ubiquinone biosynthesis (AarF/ABC1/UbiB family)